MPRPLLAPVTTAVRSAKAGGSFGDRVGAIARAYVDFATGNAALLDLMYTVKHDPAASEALIAASGGLTMLAMELIEDGQRRGEVRQGPVERIALPVMTALHGFAVLAVSGMLPAEEAGQGLEDTVAFILRGCAP
jgi:hypothetical protein